MSVFFILAFLAVRHTWNSYLRVFVCVVVFRSPTSAHQPPRGPSGGGPGPQSHPVVGAGQRRPLPGPLLHGPVPRAAGQQLDRPLCLRQPRDSLLHGGQVNGREGGQTVRPTLPVKSLDTHCFFFIFTIFYTIDTY